MKTRKGLFNYTDSNGSVNWKLYDTVIVQRVDHQFKLYTNGFRTNHTKNCINDIIGPMGYKVFQKGFEWYVQKDGVETWEFREGFSIPAYQN